MKITAEIVRKLSNARFQPPGGGAEEKLAWINNGEADLLRSIGGSGKKRKFGLPSFSFADNNPGAGFGSRNTGVNRSDSSGASNARNSGVGGVGSQMQQNRDGSLSRISRGVAPPSNARTPPMGVPHPALRPATPPMALPLAMAPVPRMNPFAKFSGLPISNPGWSTDPTQPTSPISYGPIGGGKFQDRLSQRSGMGGLRGGWGGGFGRAGRSGGGHGGGGGGGW